MTPLMLSLLLAAGKCPAPSDVPSPGSCHFQADGRPDPHCTPGEVDPEMDSLAALCGHSTQAGRCHPSKALRKALFLAYGLPWPAQGEFEVDHFIEESLGGAQTVKNLWPEAAPGFHAKDRLEAWLKRQVCAGKLSLAAARAMLLDFPAVLKQLGVRGRRAMR